MGSLPKFHIVPFEPWGVPVWDKGTSWRISTSTSGPEDRGSNRLSNWWNSHKSLVDRVFSIIIIIVTAFMDWWNSHESLTDRAFSVIKVIVAVFILVCLLSLINWIWLEDSGIVILPFEAPPKQDYNGQALSDLLTHELVRIKEIHQTEMETNYSLQMENYSIPEFTPEDFTLSDSLYQSGTLGQGPVSLSIGDILISLKRLLPLAKSSRTLSASLQNYGTNVILVASLPSSKGLLTWQVSSKDNCSQEEIPQLIETLAYQVAYSICDPESGSAHTWQTFANITQGREAYLAYQSTNNPTHLERARQMAIKSQKCEPEYKGSSDLLIAVGLAYLDIGNNDQAMSIFDEAIRINPEHTMARTIKGNILGIQGKYDEAIQAFDKAIEINPQDASVWSNKGNVLYYLGKYDESIRAYDMAIEIDPQFTEAWKYKGNVLYHLGKYDEAIKTYDKAIEIDPKYAEAWSNKGTALVDLGKYDEALQALDVAIELNPHDAGAWNSKSAALSDQGKNDEALQALDKAIELDPQYATAWNNKGTVLADLGRYDEAVKTYDKAIELNPQFAAAWNSKGAALSDQGKYDEALQALDKAIELNPQYAEAWYNKGNALERLNRTNEADSAYAKASELGYSGWSYPL